jgi:hypothetical protein
METYLSLGRGATPAIAAIGALIIIGDLIYYAVTKKIGRVFVPMMVLGAWYIACGLFELPDIILFPVTILIGIVPNLFNKKKPMKAVGRIAYGMYTLVLCGFCVFIQIDQKLTLTADRITSAPKGFLPGSKYENGTLTKAGLALDITKFQHNYWPFGGSYTMWSLEIPPDGRLHYPAIGVTSTDYYWGPHGLVRGITVGQRLAEWSGAKATYDDYPPHASLN